MSGIEVTDHFSEVTRMVQIGSESRRNIAVVSWQKLWHWSGWEL